MVGTDRGRRRVDGRRRAAWRTGGVGVLAATACLVAPGLAAAAQTTTTAGFTTPGQYMFTVPAGVSSVSVTAVGGAGGTCFATGGEAASVAGTFAVQPGQQLQVGVAGAGGGCVASGGTGAGGVGGGGAGGITAPGFGGTGAGGGGASEVGSGQLSPAYPANLLLVAAGGGGDASPGGQGGNAGSPGQSGPLGSGGGAGTATAGGAGGADVSGVNANGMAGSFGLGGAGGGADLNVPAGGGGGGGGYFGGGGGAGGSLPPVGGGGGGSSFLATGATDTAGPTLTTAPASVTITYPTPTPSSLPSATLSPRSLAFSRQPLGTISSQLTVKVSNSGAAPLLVYGVQTAGADPGDYLIDDLCQQPVAPGSSCRLGVLFAPQATGTRTATLNVVTNAPSAPAAVALSGTGARRSHGVSSQQGPAGPAGQVVCQASSHGVAMCEIECAPGTYKLQVAAVPATFTIQQADVVVAHGTLQLRRGVVARHRLRLTQGSYTLIISTGHGARATVLVRARFHVR